MPEILGNLTALQQAIADSDSDAVIAMSPENVPYASGVLLWTQRFIRDRLALVVLPKEGAPIFITATNEEGYVREKTWIEDVRGYVQHRASPIEVLADVLREKGMSAGRIGIEPGYLSFEHYTELINTLPEASFVSCEDLFSKVRMIKTSAELEVLRRGAVATEHALMATYSTVHAGESERNLVTRLGGNILQARGRVARLFVPDHRPQHRPRPPGPDSSASQGRRPRQDRLWRLFLRILF